MKLLRISCVALALSGCSSVIRTSAVQGTGNPPAVISATEGPSAQPDVDRAPVDYVHLVSEHAIAAKLRSNSAAPLEISAARRAVLPQPGAWVVCLRAWPKEGPTYMAFFFDNTGIVDFRGQVKLDRCEIDNYAPLP